MKRMVDPQVPAWGEANKPRIFEFLQFLDSELNSRPYIAGEQFTVADITALAAVDFLKLSKLAVPENLANLRRWREAVSARPSAAA
jgi:glutathione S-transferase